MFASSLAATATLIDSGRKDARRAHWDKILGEARAQVQATETQQQNRLDSLAHATGGETLEEAGTKDSSDSAGYPLERTEPQLPKRRRSQSRVDTWTDVFDWAGRQAEARAASGFQDWRGPSLDLLQRLSPEELQQLLSSDVLLHRFYGGPDSVALVDETPTYDHSARKTRTLEYSVAKLVMKLLLHSSSAPQNPVPRDKAAAAQDSELLSTEKDRHHAERELNYYPDISSPPGEKPQAIASEDSLSPNLIHNEREIHQRIAEINSHLRVLKQADAGVESRFFEDHASPSVPKYCGRVSAKLDEAKALNNSLHKLLNSMSCEKDPRSLVSKICFNLLTSKAPPNIHSYNMLLMRFCHLNNKGMVRAVLRSMSESHIRPNEITHSTLLRHYTVTEDGAAFTDYLLLMSGYNGGLAIAARDQTISPMVTQRYRFFGKSQVKAAEKARMNGEVYEAMIVGALRFFGEQTAMQYYRQMISEGWRSSVDLLTAILKSCCRKHDWEAGVSVWDQVIATVEGAHRSCYEWMLYLCSACGQNAAFDQVLRDGVDQGVLPPSLLEEHQNLGISSEDVKLFELSRLNRATTEAASFSYVATSAKSLNTKMHLERLSLKRKLKGLSAEISETSAQVKMQQSTLEAAQPDIPELIQSLSVNVNRINENDSQKMDAEEQRLRQNHLHGRLQKNEQVKSRTMYEKYKSEVMSKLEQEDRDHGDPTTLIPAGAKKQREPYSRQDGYMSRALRDGATLPMPSNIPHPATWRDLDGARAQMSGQ